MTTGLSETVSKLDRLIADFSLTQKKIRGISAERFDLATVKTILAEDVLPSFIALAREVRDIDDGVQDLFDQEESLIRPDLAAVIMSAFRLGVELADEVEKSLSKLDDDLAKKKLGDKLKGFRQATEVAVMCVDQVMEDDGETDEVGEEEESPPAQKEEEDPSRGEPVLEKAKEE